MRTHCNSSHGANQAPAPRFITLRELFDKPEEDIEWLVEDLLPTGGLSALVAKPKVGKTTLSRQLVLAVSRGEPFLGRTTRQGPVLYAALQEKESFVRQYFKALGANGDEPIHTHIAAAPEDAIAWLRGEIERVRPVLATIDTLFRFKRVRDGSAYNEVLNEVMAPLLTMARETGTHVLVTHHMGKHGEGSDGTLGATSIFGEVDTLIIMTRDGSSRSISTEQRYGEMLPDTALTWDSDTCTMSLGRAREEEWIDFEEIDRIMSYLRDKKEPIPESEIIAGIHGRTGSKTKTLRQLVKDKRVIRTGNGRKGDPYLYAASADEDGVEEQLEDRMAETKARWKAKRLVKPEDNRLDVAIISERLSRLRAARDMKSNGA